MVNWGSDLSNMCNVLPPVDRQELNLRCERCDHGRVRAEHSLAQLPGALVLHIKRFKPVASSLVPATLVPATPPLSLTPSPATASSSGGGGGGAATGAAAAGDAAAGAGGGDEIRDNTTTPSDEGWPKDGNGVNLLGESSSGGSGGSGGGGSGGNNSGGGGRESDSRSESWGVSYVKLTSPVSIPLELDLSRFCTRYTGNPPVDDLGQVGRCSRSVSFV